jgi:hypothetical protein
MGTVKMILGIALIVAAIIVCIQVIPPEMTNFQFQDDLKEVAVVGGSNPNKTDEDLRNAILLKAKMRELPLTPEQVSVQRIGQPGLAGVYLQVDYSVPVNLPGYSFTLHFTPNSGNR